MKKIKELYSLEKIKDIYYINDNLEVINIKTGHIKSVSIGKRGYPYVTLETDDGNNKINKKVFMHKIIALAFINNGPYELIEHKDDNPLNYHPNNLEFGTHSTNGLHAFQSGLNKRQEKQFKFMTKNVTLVGTIKELSILTKIPKGTLYDNVYNNRNSNFKIIELTR